MAAILDISTASSSDTPQHTVKCDGQTNQSTTEPEYSYTDHAVATNGYNSVQSSEDAWLLWTYGNINY